MFSKQVEIIIPKPVTTPPTSGEVVVGPTFNLRAYSAGDRRIDLQITETDV